MKKLVFIAYALFLLFFVVFSYLFVDSNLFYLKLLITDFFGNYRLLSTVLYFSFLFVFFIFYLYFLLSLKRKKITKKDVFIVIGITIFALFLSYPAMLSFDIFNYLATAKVAFLYHENPYLIMPIEITKEPLLAFMHAPNKVALYGPLWIFLTGIPYFLSFGKFVLFLFEMKLLVVGFYTATVVILWKLSKNIFPVLFFALNPLVIIETLVSGHNDVVMLFFALLSFYFLLNRKVGRGIIFIFCSILIKYATIFLIPVFVLRFFRKLDRDKLFTYAVATMSVIFLLSPLREELYPWYFIWILPFVALSEKRTLQILSIAFSFGLMLRYIPFMLLGTYFGPTPLLRDVLMTTPMLVTIIVLIILKHFKIFNLKFEI